jgi:hypothetical protein
MFDGLMDGRMQQFQWVDKIGWIRMGGYVIGCVIEVGG